MSAADFTPLYACPAPAAAKWNFAFVGEELLLDAGGGLPDCAALAALPAPEMDYLIGRQAGEACRLLAWPTLALPPGWSLHNLRQAWGQIDAATFAVAARARMLLAWDRQHRFCGACGTLTRPLADEALRQCPACGVGARPRQSPAVMVLVHRGDEVLLARSPHFRPGMYTALAGFVEPGESLEDCVRREVREEVGLEVSNLRWFGSQAWPFPDSLMLAFHADYAGGELSLQPGEIEDARWVRHDARLAEWPHPGSISYHLLRSVLRPSETVDS